MMICSSSNYANTLDEYVLCVDRVLALSMQVLVVEVMVGVVLVFSLCAFFMFGVSFVA